MRVQHQVDAVKEAKEKIKEAHVDLKKVVKEAKKKRKEIKVEMKKPPRPFNFIKDVNGGMYICPTCDVPFVNKKERDSHYDRHSQVKYHKCQVCFKTFKKKQMLHLHARLHTEEAAQTGGSAPPESPSDTEEEDDFTFTTTANIFGGLIRIETLQFSNATTNLLDRLKDSLQAAYEKLMLDRENNPSLKVYFSLKAVFYKAANSSELTSPPPSFNSEPIIILAATNIQEIVEMVYANLTKQLDNYSTNGSGWVLNNLNSLDMNITQFNPLGSQEYCNNL